MPRPTERDRARELSARPGQTCVRSTGIRPTYIPRPAADSGFRWHVAAYAGTGTTSALDHVCAGQGLFSEVVAGVGFEPTQAEPTVLQPSPMCALTCGKA
jgi:hypothetical protein